MIVVIHFSLGLSVAELGYDSCQGRRMCFHAFASACRHRAKASALLLERFDP